MKTSILNGSPVVLEASSKEKARLAALYAYEALDTAADERIDELTRAAAELFRAPVAAVTLLDQDRQWAKSVIGTDIRQVPRTEGFSSLLLDIAGPTLVIPDARLNPALRTLPLVLGPTGFRFYAGAKLLDAAGHLLGVLCVLDHCPGQVTAWQLRQLESLAAAVVTALDLSRSETTLRRNATRDALTGLGNREGFEAAVCDAVDRRVAPRCAVLAVDLGRFSQVTDLTGHTGGEDLLRQAADRLRQVARRQDVVARLAGDEFALLLHGVDGDEAKAVGDEILDRLLRPYDINGLSIPLSPSIGIASYPDDATTASDLLRHAADAAYWAKRRGRKTAVRFDVGLHHELIGRQLLERDLRAAVVNGAFRLEWQPICCAKTGAVSGYEALLCWDRHGHGIVDAAVLMSVAESAGLATAIDSWLLDAACCTAAGWAIPYQVGIPLSAASLQQSDLPAIVQRVLRLSGLRASRLQIEVGSQPFLDPAIGMAARVGRLRELGIGLAISDFGAGVTAVAAFLDVPFDIIKLSGSLVRAAGTGGRHDAVAAAALQLAKSLGQQVCATGVETVGQYSFLLRHGCDKMQGELVGRPTATPVGPDLQQAAIIAAEEEGEPLGAIRGISLSVALSCGFWFGLHKAIGILS